MLFSLTSKEVDREEVELLWCSAVGRIDPFLELLLDIPVVVVDRRREAMKEDAFSRMGRRKEDHHDALELLVELPLEEEGLGYNGISSRSLGKMYPNPRKRRPRR